jgi:hypothetical protein
MDDLTEADFWPASDEVKEREQAGFLLALQAIALCQESVAALLGLGRGLLSSLNGFRFLAVLPAGTSSWPLLR